MPNGFHATMSGRTEAMERRAVMARRKLHHEDRISDIVDSAIVTTPPHPNVHGSYNMDQETSSEDDFSDPEFGGNYKTSNQRPWSRPLEYPDDYVVTSLSNLENQHRVMRPHLQRQMPGPYKILHIAARMESANLPMLEVTQLASNTRLEPLKTNVMPELPILLASRACVEAGKGVHSRDSINETVCGPGMEHNSSAATPPKQSDKFTSQCSIRQKCPGPYDNSKKHLAAQQISSSTRPGPVVNHYPQPKRRRDVKCAIDGVDDVFELPKACGPAGGAEIEVRGRVMLETNNSGQHSCVWEEYWSSSVEPLSTDLHKDMATNPQDSLIEGFVQVIGEDYHNSEPVDGENDGRQRSSTTNASLPTTGRSQGGPSNNGSGGSGKRNRSNSCDRPNPQSPPTKKLISCVENGGFPCVFHNPCNPEEDETSDCATMHRFVSQLRVHHGCNTHNFFYCINCFAEFPNKSQRDAHGRSRCRNFKCVTEDCPNFNTFEMSTCDHPTAKNSQEAVWRALFRLAHPDSPIPLGFGDRLAASSPAAGQSGPSRRTDRRPSNNNMALTPRPRGQLTSTQSSGGSIPTRGSLFREASESDPCYVGLRALTRALVTQLNAPDPEGLELLHRMYPSYMDHEIQSATNYDGHNSNPGTVQGIRTLNEMLWEVVQNPNDASPTRIQRLRTWAEDILPNPISQLNSTVTSPSVQEIAQHPQFETPTPTPIAAGLLRDGYQRAQSVPLSNMVPGSQEYDQSFNSLIFDPLSGFNLDLYGQPIGTSPSTFNNVSQQYPAQFHDPAPSYMPFTQEDSAEALPQDGTVGRAASKNRTSDSGYGTGRTNNSG